jgi:hypothetical protein
MQALPLLSSVIALVGFFLFLFSLIAVQTLMLSYHYACMDPFGNLEGDNVSPDHPDEFGCGWRTCPSNYTCEVSL